MKKRVWYEFFYSLDLETSIHSGVQSGLLKNGRVEISDGLAIYTIVGIARHHKIYDTGLEDFLF